MVPALRAPKSPAQMSSKFLCDDSLQVAHIHILSRFEALSPRRNDRHLDVAATCCCAMPKRADCKSLGRGFQS